MSSDGDFCTACRLWSSHLNLLFSLQFSVSPLVCFQVLLWMRSPMLSKRQASEEKNSVSGNQWIIQPESIPVPSSEPPAGSVTHGPATPLNKVMTEQEEEKRAEPIRIRAKGLLERRGSSASLTIELLPSAAAAAAASATQDASALVTPTRECTAEEYLASAGNVLSRSQLRQVLRDTRALHREFWDLPLNHPEKTMVVGCGPKNRYRSILPNERSRVCLPAVAAAAAAAPAADKLDQYINANYIRGYDGEERAYIATQGPLAHTLADFWSLVWSERVPAIVMVTRLVEQGRVKCENYLPEAIGDTCSYADINVTVLSVECKGGHFLRKVRLERNGVVRHVLHFWYESWPDHKTPPGLAAACDLVSLAQEVESVRRGRRPTIPSPMPVATSSPSTAFPWDDDGTHAAAVGRLLAEMDLRENHNQNDALSREDGEEEASAGGVAGPVLVHCSAGIGRTGCFVAVSIGISQLLHEGNVDVLGIVCQMRIDRGGMIQTAEQYEFVHRALCLFEETLPPPGE